ncbi:MAG: hypothetical protein JSV26_03610 [bacterium]|nr:MAG: hypothetical protein JSV26_03610 [bacterium]
MKKLSVMLTVFVVPLLFASRAPVVAEPHYLGEDNRWVIEDVLDSAARPFAIGHRGYGENRGEIPGEPIENTVEAATRAFREGVQIVEVDTVLTRDNIPVALHDDYLDDLTCVNSLYLEELKVRLEDVSTLRHVLQKARTFSQERSSDRPSGLVVVEIKAPSPLCDPEDETIPALVDAVLGDIAATKMENQVIVESYSPEILGLVMMHELDIPRMLAVSLLQLLPAEVIEAMTDLEVTPIEKDAGFDLQWGEIGMEIGGQIINLYRMPGYVSLEQYTGTLFATGSRSASLEKDILAMLDQPPLSSPMDLIDTLHGLSFDVLVFTVNSELEWTAVAAWGADGMYVDDIPLGLSLEGCTP